MWLYCTYYGPKLLVLACPQLWSWQVHCQKELLSDLTVLPLFDSLFWSKPSLKIRTARAIFWNYLGIFRDYGLKNIFFRKKNFFVFKDRKLKLSYNCYISDIVEILWGFTKFFSKQMLKISVFYLIKQKSFIPKKIWFRP